MVLFTLLKKGSSIIKKVKKINPNLRKLIMEQAYSKVIQEKGVKEKLLKEIQKFKTTKSPKVKKVLREKQKRKLIIRKILRNRFSLRLARESRRLLKTHHVRHLRKTQFKDTIKMKRSNPKVEKHIVRIPKGLIKHASRKNLRKFVSFKFRVEREGKK